MGGRGGCEGSGRYVSAGRDDIRKMKMSHKFGHHGSVKCYRNQIKFCAFIDIGIWNMVKGNFVSLINSRVFKVFTVQSTSITIYSLTL